MDVESEMHREPRVLVLGGSGFVGRHLCEHLVRLAWQVTVPTRRWAHALPLQIFPSLTVIEADVHDEDRLAELIAGQDAVVNLVAILHGSEAQFEAAHVALPQRIARAMQRAACLDSASVTGTSPLRRVRRALECWVPSLACSLRQLQRRRAYWRPLRTGCAMKRRAVRMRVRLFSAFGVDAGTLFLRSFGTWPLCSLPWTRARGPAARQLTRLRLCPTSHPRYALW